MIQQQGSDFTYCKISSLKLITLGNYLYHIYKSILKIKSFSPFTQVYQLSMSQGFMLKQENFSRLWLTTLCIS